MEQLVNEMNVKKWDGFSELYHNCRPIPPDVITKIILTWLKREPKIVVDIGSGTGLSTKIWDGIAKKIIGIEPNDDMRATAERFSKSNNIIYKKGFSNDTSLPSDYADIITVATAFHWMDVDSTLIEIHRILKDGGIFAIYVSGYPSIMDWMVDKAFRELSDKCADISYSQKKSAKHNIRDGISYLEKIKHFGKFKYSKEAACHSEEKCTYQRLMDLTLTQGSINDALKINPSLNKQINEFSDLIKTRCGAEFNIIFSYKVWITIK